VSRSARKALATLALLSLGACGGGGGSGGSGSSTGSSGGSPPPPTFSAVPRTQISGTSTYAADCGGANQSGTLYPNTALEPSLVVNPTNPDNLIAEWQQDRWSNGGSQALNLAASFDGGQTWQLSQAAFSLCSGGGSGNAGNFARASNGWLSASPSGVVYALSLSFTGVALAAGSSSGQLVAQSSDGGLSWSAPVALITDSSGFFDDKGAITADPNDADYVYAVWDRLQNSTPSFGPSYFAMTADGGASWQSALSIYDPGPNNQTIGNQIVVLPDGVLLDIFTELDGTEGASPAGSLRLIQSSDHGASWSAPVSIAAVNAVLTHDPLNNVAVRDAANLFAVSVSPQGTVYVVWQDAEFSNFAYNGIALSQSSDDGATWSAPVQINADTHTPAFTPSVNVRADGVIAVTYYDFRNDTVPGELLTDYWMVSSSDAVTFQEAHLAGPFALESAPEATNEGLFLGDYQALRSTATAFLPAFAQTPPDSPNETASSVFIAFPPASAVAAAFHARAAPRLPMLSAAARQRLADSIRHTRAARLGQP
jgi:hypothetical protein